MKTTFLYISLISRKAPWFATSGLVLFKLFIENLCNLQSPVIWVFPTAHGTVNTPEAAMVKGLVRTFSMEDRALDITLLKAALGV
ncbi:hypothetical protein MCOR27_000034 [Pyricularia oryzae]|uniref:Uncharacterized protein n=1 Tax=Pyricularia grisea TaxID=148305 RepID=A0ABQ8NHC4_PYRGI|nr:hypothetical protein MCOR01_002769 [Pyricularia oryzae]KAI6297110.1 hypothetical protein MCOR33_006498 [Pyricularia grisea]KAH9427115.1 hypothetical protein MCOR02_012473 [Pyricularia oryzae]KAH9427186.1 hypothetical protein MCOR02_012404 [Pyricularia oryzae]KAH9432968.1 hypothetical protein MCOR02_007641 [Pyricularia oryzae]